MKSMYLVLTLGIILFGSVFSGNAQEVAPDPNAPVITFVNETHDFGLLEEGPKASYDFVFKNTGKSPLVLQQVKASCGCTTPSWPKEPIMPGQSGTITAVYSTTGRPGKFNKSISIMSNASEPNKVIYIKGEVKSAPKEAPVGMPERKPSMLMEGTF